MLSLSVTPTDLSRLLSERLESAVQDVTPLAAHAAHRMYSALWEQPDGPMPIIVRFYLGTRAEEDARTEANALRELYRAGYPVPECFLLVERSTLVNAPFVVMQRLLGQPLGAVAEAHPENIASWLDKASALLLKLHSLKWQSGFDSFQPALSPLEFAERQIKWWLRQAQVVSAEAAADGFSWLRGNLYRARRAKLVSLVHRDFHPNNLLAEDGKITGVVDWGELTLADPAVDVAWTRMVLSTEVNPELGDTFTDAYFRRNPDIGETLGFWEVFAACKRLAMLAKLASLPPSASTPTEGDPAAGESLSVAPNAIQRVCDFMQQRLADDD